MNSPMGSDPRNGCEIQAEEQRIITLCQSADFTLEKLAVLIGQTTNRTNGQGINPK
jgi:hypothetical protein